MNNKSSNSNQKIEQPSRRQFIKGAGTGVAGAVALGTGAGSLLASQQVKAKPAATHISATMLRMARDIYPHDKIEDKYYQQIVDNVIKDNKDLVADGVADLDKQSKSRLGSRFVDAKYEPDRIRILRSMETGAFFTALRTGLLFGIYNNKELFPLFGYQGSSWEKGGYENRGLNDLDWLEE
jgi:hypothetical protein